MAVMTQIIFRATAIIGSSLARYLDVNKRLLSIIFCEVLISSFGVSALAQDHLQVDLSKENLGKVHLGDMIHEVMKEIGQPDESSKQLQDAMNGCLKQIHFYNNGLEVETCTTKNGERVHSLRVVKSSKIQTARGLSTGATAEQVMDIYPRHERKAKHSIVVLDRRRNLRLRFLLENNRVYEISLYPMRPKARMQVFPKRKRRRSLFD